MEQESDKATNSNIVTLSEYIEEFDKNILLQKQIADNSKLIDQFLIGL